MRKTIIILAIVIIAVLFSGWSSYALQQNYNKHLEEQNKKAHNICERANSVYLSHVKGFGANWYVSCYNEDIGINEEVRFK